MKAVAAVVIALVLAAPASLEGQHAHAFQPVAVSPLLIPETPPHDPSFPRGTWSKEGAIVGAIVVGILAYIVYDNICGDHDADQNDEHCGTASAGAGAIGVLAGAALGALIGGKFQQH